MADQFTGPVLLALVVVAGLGTVAPIALLRLPPVLPLVAYAFVLPWGSAVSFPVAPDPFNTLSTLVGLGVTFSLLLRLMMGWREVRGVHGSVLAWLALLGWLILTVLWSVAPDRSLSALAVLVSLVALFLLGALLRVEPRQLKLIELGAVGGGLVVAVQALLTAARGGLGSTSSRLPRFTYDDGDPNILAASLLLPLALAVWWAFTVSGRRRQVAASAAALGLFSAILVTGSRGGILSALVVLLVVLVYAPGLRLSRVGACVGGLLLLLPALLVLLPDGLRAHLTQTSSTGRSEIWRVGLQACLTECDRGSGYGTFARIYRQMYLEDLSLQGVGDQPYAAHNVFLSIAVEAGFVGLLLMVAAFVLLGRGVLRLPHLARGPALAALAGLVTSNMLVSNLGFKYFWLSLLYATLCLTAYERRPAAALVER